jgi:hypothetical protein
MISRQNFTSGVGRAHILRARDPESDFGTDIQFENHGSVWLVRPLTVVGREWIDENVSDDAQWFGGALAVEPRYVGDIVEGMQIDGLEVG